MIILNWKLYCSSRPQQLFIDSQTPWLFLTPWMVQLTFGVDIDHFENHWATHRKVRRGAAGNHAESGLVKARYLDIERIIQFSNF